MPAIPIKLFSVSLHIYTSVSSDIHSHFPTSTADLYDYEKWFIERKMISNKEVHSDVTRPSKVKGSAPFFLLKGLTASG